MEGQGVEFEVHNPVPGNVGPFGDDAAPSNLFAELLTANHRPVRLHAAMMLTFLGDPRARDAVLELREALREDEAPYLNRLIVAQAPVKVCKLQIEAARQAGSACLFNAGTEARKDLGLRVRGLAAEVSHGDPVGQPPEVRSEASYHVPGALEPNDGRVVSFAFDLRGERAETFEAFADRFVCFLSRQWAVLANSLEKGFRQQDGNAARIPLNQYLPFRQQLHTERASGAHATAACDRGAAGSA